MERLLTRLQSKIINLYDLVMIYKARQYLFYRW